MSLTQLRLHEPLAVADAAQAHVADVRLARDERHRHAVAQLALAQIGVEDHRELVGRAEAARAGRRADDDRAGILQELLVFSHARAACSWVQTDCVKPAGPRPGTSSKASFGPGRDHEVVVVELLPVAQRELRCRASIGVDGFGDPLDALRLERPAQLHARLLGTTPADGDPRIRRRELEVRRKSR